MVQGARAQPVRSPFLPAKFLRCRTWMICCHMRGSLLHFPKLGYCSRLNNRPSCAELRCGPGAPTTAVAAFHSPCESAAGRCGGQKNYGPGSEQDAHVGRNGRPGNERIQRFRPADWRRACAAAWPEFWSSARGTIWRASVLLVSRAMHFVCTRIPGWLSAIPAGANGRRFSS